jgi:DNA-binding response OmpR family regulator
MSSNISKILLVEDALDLACAIQQTLEREGYSVSRAADGEQALDLFVAYTPDLIILDWMLPKVDGLEVLRQVRAGSPVPVLMLTARSEEFDRVLGLEIGADDYLTKPFSMRELVARVRALLRRIEHVQQIVDADRQRQTSAIHYQGLHLNPETYEVTLDYHPIDLTRTEFDLLHLFLSNPGRVFSRAYLLDTVWRENYIPGDRSVDNAILRLRKKLGTLGEAIETVWGVGYRLQNQNSTHTCTSTDKCR